MSYPINFRLQFQDGVSNKVSHISPYNLFTVYATVTKEAVLFQCKVSKSNGKKPNHTIGTVINEVANPTLNTEFSFIVNAIDIFPTEGEWDVAFYLKYSDGTWSDYVAFKVLIPPEKVDNTPMCTINNEYVQVLTD